MGIVASNTNLGLAFLSTGIGEACKLESSVQTNISLKGLSMGNHGGISSSSFQSSGGPANGANKIGGSNNPLQSTGDSDMTSGNTATIGAAPYHMSHCIGIEYDGSGPGR